MTTPPTPTIVVGVDGGEPGWWALNWALDEAAGTGARLAVCRVYPPRHHPPPGDSRNAALVLELADPVLVRSVNRIRARLGGARVDLLTPVGDAGEQLVATGGDLLVVGAPRGPSLSPLSTARWVAGHASCPVVVVRPVRDSGLFAGHVVVGVDGSAPAGRALVFGFRYAVTHGIPLAAVLAAGTDGETAGDVWVDDTFAETHVAPPPPGLEVLDVAVEPLRREHPAVPVKRAVYRGGAVPALLRAAAGSRLLVVGDRGRGAAARPLLGSTSQGVVAHAAGPVAVTHRRP